jgi:hypothetical protein
MYWSDKNSHQVTDKEELNVPGVRVWVGIWAGGVIGPFFIECTVDCQQSRGTFAKHFDVGD